MQDDEELKNQCWGGEYLSEVSSVLCTVYSVQCTGYSVQCTVYSVQRTVNNVHENRNCAVYTSTFLLKTSNTHKIV